MLRLVQGYRGVAACAVVLFHSALVAQHYFGDCPPLHVFDSGWAGVQFFFVLSGFIILHVHGKDIGIHSRVLPYLKKRALRIYPPYILITLALAPVWFIWPTEPYHRSMGSFVASLLLVPQPHYPHLDVAWTLIHEVMFYLAFAVLIIHRRAGLFVLGAWFAAVIAANLFLPALSFPATYALSVNNLLFGLGMLAAACRRNFGWPLFIAANAGFVASILWVHEPAVLIICLGLCSAGVILCAQKLDEYFARWQVLGDASYSIYLTHYPVISLVCKLLKATGAQPVLTAFVLGTVASIAAGIAFHRRVEKPLLRYLQR